MAEVMVCKLCRNRRAKRSCPAVGGEICAICCGEEREATLSCPLDCTFLREARKREKTVAIPVEEISNPKIEITEEFVRSHEELLLYCVYSLLQSTLRTQHAVDNDALEALHALIQTQLTAHSGLIYETRAGNPVAESIQHKFGRSLDDYERQRVEQESLAATPAGDTLKILVFLHRIGQQNSNGRAKGRMFIDMLRAMTPDTRVDERAPSIILE